MLLDTNLPNEGLRKLPTLAVTKALCALRAEERFASEVARHELRAGAARLRYVGRQWQRIQQEVLPLVRWLPLSTTSVTTP